jgi:hypothetical protein
MANPKPNIEGLRKGGGRRPLKDKAMLHIRTTGSAIDTLEAIAQSYGCVYGGKPWIAGLLGKIGTGELTIVPSPPRLLNVSPSPVNQDVLDESKHEPIPTELDALVEASAKTMKVIQGTGTKPTFGPPIILKGQGPSIAELVSEGRR